MPAANALKRLAALAQNTYALGTKGKAFTDNTLVSMVGLPGDKGLALSEPETHAIHWSRNSSSGPPPANYPPHTPVTAIRLPTAACVAGPSHCGTW